MGHGDCRWVTPILTPRSQSLIVIIDVTCDSMQTRKDPVILSPRPAPVVMLRPRSESTASILTQVGTRSITDTQVAMLNK